MRYETFRCDQCKKEETALGLPSGWLQVTFWNQKLYYYHLCSYPCLTLWSEKRDEFYNQGAQNKIDSVTEKVSDSLS